MNNMSNARNQLDEIIEQLSENEVIFILEFLKRILHLD